MWFRLTAGDLEHSLHFILEERSKPYLTYGVEYQRESAEDTSRD